MNEGKRKIVEAIEALDNFMIALYELRKALEIYSINLIPSETPSDEGGKSS